MPSINPLMASMNAMNDKSVLNMMPNFDDPVEQSLASLEQLACKFDDQLNPMHIHVHQQFLQQQKIYFSMLIYGIFSI